VTKAVNRADVFKTFRGKGLFEILPADAVDTMTSEFLPPLVDKDPVLIKRFWGCAVFLNIELKQMTGFGLKLYKPEAVSLSQDSQGHLLRVKVVQIQCCYFTGPGSGIV